MEKRHDKIGMRLAIIITKFNAGDRLSIDELAKEFAVSKRTIQRDMQERLIYLPIEHQHGLYYLQEQYLGKFNLDDIKNFATLSGIKELYPNLDNKFLASMVQDKFNTVYLVKGSQYEVSETIAKKLKSLEVTVKNHYLIKFTYNKKQRDIKPYRLVNTHGIWYLVGDEKGQLKTYTVSKILNLQISNTIFTLNDEFIALIEENKDTWFSQYSIEVILEIDASVSEYFLKRALLPHQKTIDQTKDKLTIYTKVSYEEEILKVVKAWIPHIKILSPISLQNKLEKTLKLYLQ